MDPTFRQFVIGMLSAIDGAHPEPAEGISWDACPGCHEPMPDGRAQHLLDEIAALVVMPALEPHVVHVDPPASTKVRRRTYDPDRSDRKKPDGEDVRPAHRRTRLDVGSGELLVDDVPEERTPFWGFDEFVPDAPAAIDCPDCGRGLTSRGIDLICPLLSRKIELQGCHDHRDGFGCLVACGTREPTHG